MTQPQALQLLFDVRFILRLLVWPLASPENCPTSDQSLTVEGISAIGHDLLKRFESAVDPFDLEMASESLNAGISHAVRTTTSLYASLLPVASMSPTQNYNRGKEGEKDEEFSNLAFLALTPYSKALESKEKKEKEKAPVFGLLPFSLSQVRPPPQVTTSVKAISQPEVGSNSTSLIMILSRNLKNLRHLRVDQFPTFRGSVDYLSLSLFFFLFLVPIPDTFFSFS